MPRGPPRLHGGTPVGAVRDWPEAPVLGHDTGYLDVRAVCLPHLLPHLTQLTTATKKVNIYRTLSMSQYKQCDIPSVPLIPLPITPVG